MKKVKTMKQLAASLKSSDLITPDFVLDNASELSGPIHLLKLGIDEVNRFSRDKVGGTTYLEKALQEGRVSTVIHAVNSEVASLKGLIQAIKKGRLYIGVEKVSASGMSRVLNIVYVDNNEICRIADYIYKMAGCDKKRRITGCGMDMCFAAWHNLVSELLPNHDYRKLPQYRSL